MFGPKLFLHEAFPDITSFRLCEFIWVTLFGSASLKCRLVCCLTQNPFCNFSTILWAKSICADLLLTISSRFSHQLAQHVCSYIAWHQCFKFAKIIWSPRKVHDTRQTRSSEMKRDPRHHTPQRKLLRIPVKSNNKKKYSERCSLMGFNGEAVVFCSFSFGFLWWSSISQKKKTESIDLGNNF